MARLGRVDAIRALLDQGGEERERPVDRWELARRILSFASRGTGGASAAGAPENGDGEAEDTLTRRCIRVLTEIFPDCQISEFFKIPESPNVRDRNKNRAEMEKKFQANAEREAAEYAKRQSEMAPHMAGEYLHLNHGEQHLTARETENVRMGDRPYRNRRGYDPDRVIEVVQSVRWRLRHRGAGR